MDITLIPTSMLLQIKQIQTELHELQNISNKILKSKNEKRIISLQRRLKYLTSITAIAETYTQSRVELYVTRLANGYYAKRVCAQDIPIEENFLNELDEVGFFVNSIPTVLCLVLKHISKPPQHIIKLIEEFEEPDHDVYLGIDFTDVNKVKVDQDRGARYLMNAKVQHPNVKPTAEQLQPRNQVANRYYNQMLMEKKANQSRFGSFRRQLLTLFFYAQAVTEDSYKAAVLADHKDILAASDILPVQVLAYLYRKFDDIPFYTNRSGEVVVLQDGWTTCLIPLSYSLMSLTMEVLSGNVLPDAIEPIIMKRLECARTSFDQRSLERKSEVTSLYKYITSRMGKHTRVVLNESGQAKLVVYEAVPEIAVSETEIDDVNKRAANYPWLVSLTNKIMKLKPEEKVNYARKLISTMMCHDNPGIYYKTSVTLEYKKSIEPTYRTFAEPVQPVQNINWNDRVFPYRREGPQDGYWRKLEALYHNDLDKYYSSEYKKTNFEAEYVQFLTSRSQGSKADDLGVYAHSAVTPEFERIKALSQKRLIHFLLTKQLMFNEMYLFNANSEKSSSGIREQVDRRMRIIEIVNNACQLASLIILKAFDEIKVNRKEIKVGEKTGNIYGMANRLIAGGLPSNTFYFFDVAGMDASTQIDLAVFTASSLAKWISSRRRLESYFGYHTKRCEIRALRDNGSYYEDVSAHEQALLIMAQSATGKQFLYTDPVFGSTININPTFFPSGRADTSAQHSLVLTYVDDIVRALGSNADIHIEPENFGDDAVKILRSIHGPVTQKQLYRLIDQYTEVLKAFGYKIEHEASRFYSDFLQLMTFTSVTMPKSARISVFCDEHNDTSSRGVTDQFMIVRNLVGEKASRCHLPPNCMVYMRAMWQVMRFVPSNINAKVSKHLRWPYFIFPYMSQFLPPFNIPVPPIFLSNRLVPRSSWLTILGDSRLVWLWNQIITQDELEMLNKVYGIGVKSRVVNPGEIFVQKLKQMNLYDAYVLAKFSADNQRVKHNLDEFGKIIDLFANDLTPYYDHQRRMASMEATGKIYKQTGIVVPNAITYHGQPITKVRDLIETLTVTVEMREVVDARLYAFLITRMKDGAVHQDDLAELSRCCVYMMQAGPIDPAIMYNTHQDIPMVPGYVALSDYNKFNKLSGSPISESSKLSALASSLSYRVNKSQVDLIIKIGLHIKQTGGMSLLSEYFNTLNLPTHEVEKLRSAMMEEAPISIFDYYNTGFQHQHYPSISNSVDRFSGYVILTGVKSKAHEALKLMCRDYYMSTAHAHEFKMLIPTPTMHHRVRYSAQRVLRGMGKIN